MNIELFLEVIVSFHNMKTYYVSFKCTEYAMGIDTNWFPLCSKTP